MPKLKHKCIKLITESSQYRITFFVNNGKLLFMNTGISLSIGIFFYFCNIYTEIHPGTGFVLHGMHKITSYRWILIQVDHFKLETIHQNALIMPRLNSCKNLCLTSNYALHLHAYPKTMLILVVKATELSNPDYGTMQSMIKWITHRIKHLCYSEWTMIWNIVINIFLWIYIFTRLEINFLRNI